MQFEKEVLHYLGHQNQEVSPQLNQLIDESIREIKRLAMPRNLSRRFMLVRADNQLVLKPINLALKGKSIYQHLKNSEFCYVLAVTLGSKIEKQISYYELQDLTRATVLDACASAYIELVCNELAERIAQEVAADNMHITARFSPGYGDFPLTTQLDLITVLRADVDIGLTVNEYKLLFPRKSVTAIIGVENKCEYNEVDKCDKCQLTGCKFRRQ